MIGYHTLTYLFFYLNKVYGISAQYDIVIILKQEDCISYR